MVATYGYWRFVAECFKSIGKGLHKVQVRMTLSRRIVVIRKKRSKDGNEPAM